MSLIPDIVESWRAPARVLRRHLDRPRSEAFVFTFLFTFLLISFVAQMPYASRMTFFQPEVPMSQRLFGGFLGSLVFIPISYSLAALSRLIAGVMGGRGTWYGARLALFWALVAMSPGMLLMGLSLGFLGMGTQTLVLGVGVFSTFVLLWGLMLREAERG
jgi:hypothetical protein